MSDWISESQVEHYIQSHDLHRKKKDILTITEHKMCNTKHYHIKNQACIMLIFLFLRVVIIFIK